MMIEDTDQPGSYFTDDQIECIVNFVAQVAGGRSAIRDITYHITGIANLDRKDDADSLLKSLQSQDWNAAAKHCELAGANNLLVAILLHIDAEGLLAHDYWIALRSPFEYLDSASLIACGEILRPAKVSMSILPLENARERKG